MEVKKLNKLLKTSLGIKPSPTPVPLSEDLNLTVYVSPTSNGSLVTTYPKWFEFLVPARFSYVKNKCFEDCIYVGRFLDLSTIRSYETENQTDEFTLRIFAPKISYKEYLEEQKNEGIRLYNLQHKTENVNLERNSYEFEISGQIATVLTDGYVWGQGLNRRTYLQLPTSTRFGYETLVLVIDIRGTTQKSVENNLSKVFSSFKFSR